MRGPREAGRAQTRQGMQRGNNFQGGGRETVPRALGKAGGVRGSLIRYERGPLEKLAYASSRIQEEKG